MSDQPSPSTKDVEKEPDPDNVEPADSSISPLQIDTSPGTETEHADNLAPTDTDIDKKLDESNTSDPSIQSSSKSRELKLLLASSKEANLKTNISHKRKKDMKDSPKTQHDSTKKFVKVESKHFKFPVTAEAELDEIQENEIRTHVVVKKRRNTSSETANDADEGIKRNKKAVLGEYKVFKPNKDIFCWRCHRASVNVVCETCPRSYHRKCLKQIITDANHWPCPECVAILKAESTQSRSPAMKGMTLEHLCSLLKFAANRMKECHGSEPFLHPVNIKEFPDYKKYIIQPMDLTMLEKNIKDNLYGSPQAFEADAKWLLHNSIIFNSYQSKLTTAVRSMIKICKQEMIEIENCPSCYKKANTNKSTWFVEVCPKPHILVWAKLKGFPYWPAKVMSVNPSGMVDVRFFGAHDRAWVHWKECYLFSEKDPNTYKQKRFDIEKCIMELNLYIDNLKKKFEEFTYAPFRTPLDPEDIDKQITIFLPKYKTARSRRASLETDDRTESKDENVPKEEPMDEPEKSETSSNTHSNINSPAHDNDTTMEGYGTEDDMESEIDHESRKAFAGVKGAGEDDEDEDETQLTNATVLLRGKVRYRGGFTNSGPVGKLKILPRISSDSDQKSRRNSDQSDSSRVSEKINRVNISDNMEISLANEETACVTISETVTPPNDENSNEAKKKPVQVEIENKEVSISPNKPKISDQLIKRLSDGEPSTSTPKKFIKINLNGDVVPKKEETPKTAQPAIEKIDGENANAKTVPEKPDKRVSEEKSGSECAAWKKMIVAALMGKVPEKNGEKEAEKEVNESKVVSEDKNNEIIVIVEPQERENAEKKEPEIVTSENDTEKVAEEEKIDNKESPVEISNIDSNVEVPVTKPTEDTTPEDSIPENGTATKVTSELEDQNSTKSPKTTNTETSSTKPSPIKEPISVIEESDDDEDIETADDVIYDKKNIFDVIHSSLKDAHPDKNKSPSEMIRKRKLPPGQPSGPVKILKLVSIDSILKNKDKEKPKSPVGVPELDIAPEEIKSEPESEEEERWDAMEEKRKYLSALNIHEKTAAAEKKEKNEIRTRSKAEEKRERFKVVDNLTRIIDDVAMNYSALHDGEKMPARKPERRKSNASIAPVHEGGEIFVKSFAKIATGSKQKARKTFPTPIYIKQAQAQPLKAPFPKKDLSMFNKNPTQKLLNPTIPVTQEKVANTKNLQSRAIVSVPSLTLLPQPPPSTGASPMNLETRPTTMAMGQVIVMPGYCAPISNPVLNAVPQTTPLLPTDQITAMAQPSILMSITTPNVRTSQNYIPHNSEESENSASPSPPVKNRASNESTDPQKSQELADTSTPSTSNNSSEISTNVQTSPASNSNLPVTPAVEQEDEFAILNGLVPESVSLAVSELLLRPPPRLRPRPPGITSQNFDDGIPSIAGDVTAKINSIAHRMTDYFRGMLVETLEDVGRTTTPEAKITSLQLEIEALKHKHSLEMAEMRKNMCTILKDIQRSIVEERDKIVEETRAACEEETIKRVEMAKSKQWCANCPKEAQFYCCWNTSYCDYPCQQKHWPQHAGKCTQSIEKGTIGVGSPLPSRPPGQPLVLRPALAPLKPAMGRILAKPAKVYMNKTNSSQKSVKAVPSSGLTLVETTPGNYELVGNGSPMGLTGKIYTTAALTNTKYKMSTSATGTPTRPTEQAKQTTSTSAGNRSQQM